MKQYVIEEGVRLGKDVTIEPFCVIKGNTTIADGAVVESFSYICNAQIGSGAVIKSSRVTDSSIGCGSVVGPNAHVRDNAAIGDYVRIGNYVEIKNSAIGNLSKVAHLAYVGDAEVGEGCNVGCGVIFINYDGKKKHKTVVKKGCFIGCNTNLIAPVTIGEGCFIACGSTVDRDLPDNSFAIGRSRISVKECADKYLGK